MKQINPLPSAFVLAALVLLACGGDDPIPVVDGEELAKVREALLTERFLRRGIDSAIVHDAFRRVPRAAFLDPKDRDRAWEDRAFGREDGETVTAPFLSAVMLQAVDPGPGRRVLECGTRTGWFTALLAATGAEVVTVDPRGAAVEDARRRHRALGLTGITYRVGDPLGTAEGPFDAIVVNGAIRHLPRELYALLSPGGRLLAPIGEPMEVQSLIR
ncbi:MAG: protein-L-isoaspartate O-methyltransferase, partial [Planctomycetota bacterium]